MKMIAIHPMRLFLPLVVLLGSVAAGSYYLEKKSRENWVKTKSLSSSVDVCFQRITQTFVGVLIGDSSLPFLQENFRGTTAECLAELNRMSVAETAKPLNTLSDRAYWFHEEVGELIKLSGKNQLADVLNFNRRKSIIERYMKLEDAKWDIGENLRMIEKDSAQKRTVQDIIFYTSSGIFMMLSLMLAVGDFRKRKGQVEVEEKAYQLYALGPNINYQEISPLISKVLDQANLKITSDLWTRSTQWWEEKQVVQNLAPRTTNERAAAQFVAPQASMKKKSIPAFSVGLDQAWSKVMEMNNQLIFMKGIMVDLQISENLRVLSSHAEIETGLYAILANVLGYSLKTVRGKKITVQEKIGVNDSCVMQVHVSGHVFNVDEMNLMNQANAHDVHIDLLLVQELAKDLGIELELKNMASKDHGVEAVMQLTFSQVMIKNDERDVRESTGVQRQSNDTPTLVRLFKGSKKDFATKSQGQSEAKGEGYRSVV